MIAKFQDLKYRVEKHSTERVDGKAVCHAGNWDISVDSEELRMSNGTMSYVMDSEGNCRGTGGRNAWTASPYEVERKLVELIPGGYTWVGTQGVFAEIESNGLDEDTEKIPPRPSGLDALFPDKTKEPEPEQKKAADPTIVPIIKTLEDLFVKFNEKFFGGELEQPVITIAPDTCRAYGWFTTWRAWKETDNKDGEGYYEINVTSDYLDRDPVEIAGTLFHEMVHLENQMKGIKDTSRSGSYHNAKFRDAAEKRGLKVEKTKKYGFGITSPNAETAEYIKSLDLSFGLYRPTPEKEQRPVKAKKKSSTRKYVCPVCGTIIRSTKPVNVVCGDCMEPFVLVGD